MNDFQITIMALGTPLFAMIFYALGRYKINKKYATRLPLFPKNWMYYQEKNDMDNYHRQALIWLLSIILAIFCSMMLVGIVGGQIYIPKS
ncbi:hypothetical protein HZI73_02195 [Vallitalea pronyensis]|uniref:Uncharacterized protein n=1 Tax=Vallitalea pronyensis TaxID=1348613 RepID=A0A8J8MGH8_9FIRM|nr:hypothetical protein [Vallitalea pronyensis]QUI21169.1 hypothetical protein HZI73_02195 [Vallitalea pronyensis]